MGSQESNAGFVGLHNPAGMMLVSACFIFITMLIVAGGIYFRYAMQKDREMREKLQEGKSE